MSISNFKIMKTEFYSFIISVCFVLLGCNTNPRESKQLVKPGQTTDTNFLGMNYKDYSGFIDINFYDSLPTVLRQLKQMKDLRIENSSKAKGTYPGNIYLNGKFANIETDRIYLYFPDNIFTSAMVDFGFSDSDIKYQKLKEALDKKYGNGYEYKKNEGCSWDFSYYVGDEKHPGGKIFLSIVDQIYLVLSFSSENEDYYNVRQKNKAAEQISVDPEKL